MISKIKIFTLVAFASVMLYGCYPNEDIYYADTDVALTIYDQDFEFKAEQVCVLFDSVIHVVNEGEDAIKGNNDDYLITEIKKNLDKTKFNKVYVVKDTAELIAAGGDPDNIDLLIHVSVMETDTYYTYYYNYWYWYGWGWYKSGSLKSTENTDYYYYPWYPSGGAYYAYTSGTILIDMIDAKAAIADGGNKEIVEFVVWNNVINGILSGNTTDTRNRITTQVEQCFKQSPYLN